jgi:hypothetical protein
VAHRKPCEVDFFYWNSNFTKTIRSGVAQIMARKNTVFAPFERVSWDQWQLFELEEPPVRDRQWGDPRESRIATTAKGPMGERLFTIYVAPGTERIAFESSYEKCIHWLIQLMMDYPDRPPMIRVELIAEMCSRFPGLSKKALNLCYLETQRRTNNYNWSRPGAPKRIPSPNPLQKKGS